MCENIRKLNSALGGNLPGVSGAILVLLVSVSLPSLFFVEPSNAGAAHISHVSSRRLSGAVPKKGVVLPVGQNHILPSKPDRPPPHGPPPQLQPTPRPPVSIGVVDLRHPYNPHYNPDEHFEHYPDYRIMSENVGFIDSVDHAGPLTANADGSGNGNDNERKLDGESGAIVEKDSNLGTTTRTTTQRTTTTTQADWDYVCYVLCVSNMGGLACKCDVLPIG